MKIPALFSVVVISCAGLWAPLAAQGQEQDQQDRPGPPRQRIPTEVEDRRPADLDQLRMRLDELMKAGKQQEAAELKEQLSKLERQGDRPEQDRRGDPGQRLGRDREDLSRRLHHLEVAIENLHQAGLHEPAEDLEREARRMREQAPAGSPRREGRREERRLIVRGGPPMEELHAGMDDLRAQVQELRGMVRNLQEQMEREHAERERR